MNKIIALPKGFTFIELLICLSILAILSALASASYQSILLKQQRKAICMQLSALAAQQEAYLLNNGSYAENFAPFYGLTTTQIYIDTNGKTSATQSKNSTYQLQIQLLDAEQFMLTAVAIGAQSADQACTKIQLNSAGLKLPQTGNCWNE